MSAVKTIENEERIKYSEFLSSLFCSISILMFSILCLLNTLSIDLYSMMCLLKVVIPAAICFWFSGFTIGTILDRYNTKIITKKHVEESQAYEIPSIFASNALEQTEDDAGGI